jgi:pimeloyl-ACP methyl ester carboxylesterase
MERDDRAVGGATWRGVLLQAPLAQGCVIMGATEVLAGDDGRADGVLPRALRGYRLTTLSVGPLDDAPPARPEGDEVARWTTALADALRWLDEGTSTALPVGLLGAGASAAAAMRLAAGRADRVRAVVCCSGCVEVAHAAATRVRAPTLMLVGATDTDALAASRQALARLRVQARLEVIPGATRDFAEPGTLDTLAHMAGSWLRDHLAAPPLRN